MTIRTALTMLSGGGSGDIIDLEAARHVAAKFGCHIDLLHVRRDPMVAMPFVGEGMSADLMTQIEEQVTREEEAVAAKCRNIFDQWCKANKMPVIEKPDPDSGASARFVDVMGASGPMVAQYGRFADLVILKAPSVDDGDLSPASEAAIYDTGRPVLFSPRREIPTLGERVSIFWNETAEASRAAMAAMPFLKTAKEVHVMSVDDGSIDPDTVQQFAGSLAWHGVSAKVEIVEQNGRSSGEALLDAAWSFEADLIVMGAFSHSRMREMFLGGVTRHILEVAGRPVLMMH